MELLAPAGDFTKLIYACQYGADAVYASGKDFGLRAQAGNFNDDELIKAVDYCHSLNKKIYITLNIFAHSKHLSDIPNHARFLRKIGIDGVIISDPGVFSLVREETPDMPIHISTQANVTSWKAAEFWYKAGARRIIVARELSIKEISEIKQRIPELEIEIFVHGAMCMAYSGRCMLSAFLNNRSANAGLCTQPCRWEYTVMEETRPGQYFPVYEDNTGTFIFNSKDLCLLSRLREIKDAGIDSIKIEGRMKSPYYVANVTRIYKHAQYLLESDQKIPSLYFNELDKVSHRIYTEGFFDSFDSSQTQHFPSSAYSRDYQFIGEITKIEEMFAYISVKAKFSVNDFIEIIFPDISMDITLKIEKIINADNEEIMFTKPNTIVRIELPHSIPENGLVRKKNN